MLFSILFLLQVLAISEAALNGYLFYKDAVCSGEEYIKGKLVYGYGSNSNVTTLDGFTVDKYDGPCKYFRGGFFDFDYDNTDDDSLTRVGYCMQCDGVVGCAKTKNSCTDFASLKPSEDTDDDSYSQVDEYTISRATMAEDALYEQIYKSNTYLLKGFRLYSIIGGVVAMGALLGLLSTSIKYVHQQTIERKATEDCGLACIDFKDLMTDEVITLERKKSELAHEAIVLIPSFIFESEKELFDKEIS